MNRILKQVASLLVVITLVTYLLPQVAFAATYGSGKYGAGKYGVGETVSTGTSGSDSSSSTSTPSAPGCGEVAPSSAPWLYGAIPQSSNSILLYFTDAGDPVDSYALEFGTESGNYQWGATNIGGKGMRTYLVQSLQPNKTYYFRVRGGNGCATGAWSNELSAKTKTTLPFNQLATTSLELVPEPILEEEIVEEPSACSEYEVQSGDNLWNIALNELGDGSLSSKIIDLNKEKYPALTISNNLEIGWVLNLCVQQEEMSEVETEEEQLGYEVNVKVTDDSNKPIGGAKVTMHSKVQETTTDENGIAHFENVEPGDHRVIIAYNGFEGEQSINLTGDVKEFNLTVTVKQMNPFLSKPVMIVIALLATIITSMFVYIFITRHKKNLKKLS